MARQDKQFRIEMPGTEHTDEKAASGEVVLSRLLSRASADGASDGEYRVIELPPIKGGVEELLYRVRRTSRPDGRLDAVTVEMVNA